MRGQVARVDFGGCVLMLEDGSLLRATVRGRLMGPRKSLGNVLVVGDGAHFEPVAPPSDAASHPRAPARPRDSGDTEAVVTHVEPRRNAFSRRVAGRHAAEQVVAANLDQVVLVASFAEPAFRPGFADRVLCQAERAGLPARLVLGKMDLAARETGGPARAKEILDAYECAEVPCHAVCARTGQGVPDLLAACRGRRSLFVGHSGVGKSTLLNAMVPGLNLLVGRVNQRTGKGRHTTSAAWLVRPEPGLELVDTPGLRAFGLWGIGPRDLDRFYREFRDLDACRFRDCSHAGEPGCAVRKAAERGEISQPRYASFLKLRAELGREAEGQPAGPAGSR